MSDLDERLAKASILVVDIGGTHVKFGHVRAGRPEAYARLFPSAPLRSGDPVEALAAMMQAAADDIGGPDFVVSTVPAFLDTDGDRVLFAGNMTRLNGRRLASELRARLGMPIVLERDSVLALLGETVAGAGRDARSALGIFFGTGVGAAYIEDGLPFRGAGWALEIGHMPFRGEGRQLPGMRKDTLEAYASGRALEITAERHGVPVDAAFAAADPALADELAIFLRDMAFATGTAIALFSPGTVILGGGVCQMPGFPRDRLASLIESNAPIAETGRPMDLRFAALGWKAVLHGAVPTAREHFARHPERTG